LWQINGKDVWKWDFQVLVRLVGVSEVTGVVEGGGEVTGVVEGGGELLVRSSS